MTATVSACEISVISLLLVNVWRVREVVYS